MLRQFLLTLDVCAAFALLVFAAYCFWRAAQLPK